MKKKNIIIAFGCLLTLATSCVNLDQEPPSWITEEEYIQLPQTLEIVEKGVSGLYTNLWKGNYDYCCRMIRLNVCTDQMAVNPTKPLQYLYDLNPSLGLDGGKDWGSMWPNFFTVVISANKIINGTPLPEDKDEALKYKRVLAEAHFMRALSYFHLVRIFGDVPKVTSQEEGVSSPPRAAVSVIYNEVILPDLANAIEFLPVVSRSTSSNTPSKWAAKTLLADVYATMAGWPLKLGKEYYAKAAAEAKDVIEKSGLTLEDTYAGLWKEATKAVVKEHLFALHNSSPQKVASQYGTSFYPIDYVNPATGKGGAWADYYGDPTYIQTYPEGARKDFNYMTSWTVKNKQGVFVETAWQDSQHGFPAIAKYQNYNQGAAPSNGQSNGITPIYRLGETYLIYAEASVKATGTVDALAKKCLQEIQTRAGVASLTNTTDAAAFEKAVFDEYGWELFAENGKRWFQLVRTEKLAEVKPKQWANSLFKANNHYLFPIPSGEIVLAYTWENNPGY